MTLPLSQTQDVGNVLHLEHINLEVTDLGACTVFYMEALGLTRDPFQRVGPGTSWVNIGLSQFHIITKEGQEKGEVIDGHVGLIVPSIDDVIKSLKAAVVKYKNFHNYSYKFELEENLSSVGKSIPSPFLSDISRYINVTCPWGNTFRIYENNESINYRGGLGIAYIELFCNKGTAAKIGTFYQKFLGTPPALVGQQVENGDLAFAKVIIGPKQVLVFRETDRKVAYSTYHFCIYIADFSGTYHKFAKNNLFFTKHKFDDKCETIEQALFYSQFRFDRIVDPDNISEVLFVLEHEVRSVVHPNYLRPLVNRSGNVGIYCNQ